MEETLRNLELKVRHDDLDGVERLARSIGAVDNGSSRDTDTYFKVSSGRLKLREKNGGPPGVLIYYDRPDEARSRYSDYYLAHTDDCVPLLQLLTAALGILVVVVKDRHLFMYGNTRIHLDTVKNLGRFVELETVIQGQTEGEAAREHQYVKEALGLASREVLAVSYSDLLLSRLEVAAGADRADGNNHGG